MSETLGRGPSDRAVHRRIWGVSLVLSVAVWYAIRATISHDTVVTEVPILLQHDEGWAVLERSDETADIRFRGSRSDVRDLTRDQVRVVLDIRGQADIGQRTVRVDPSRIRAPAGVRAVSIRPEALVLSMDREGEQQVPVKAELQGALPEGFEVLQATCSPASVLLRGPMTRLEAVEVLRTAPVDLDGRVQGFRVRRAIQLPAGLGGARLDPDRVQVEVQIIEHSSIRLFENVPVRLLTDPSRPPPELIEPQGAAVTIQGRAELLRAMEAGSLRVLVDCTRVREEGVVELPIDVHAPAGLRATAVTPSFARVRMPPPPP